RVIATWPPKPPQTQVEVENLSGTRPSPGASRPPLPVGKGRRASQRADAPGEGAGLPIVAFPTHQDSPQDVPVPERLPSGVSLVTSTINGVFVSGGVLTKYDHEPDAETLKAFQ